MRGNVWLQTDPFLESSRLVPGHPKGPRVGVLLLLLVLAQNQGGPSFSLVSEDCWGTFRLLGGKGDSEKTFWSTQQHLWTHFRGCIPTPLWNGDRHCGDPHNVGSSSLVVRPGRCLLLRTAEPKGFDIA
jgi:hypothetical protein